MNTQLVHTQIQIQSDIAVFDVFTVILANTFKTMSPLVEAVFVNETLRYFSAR